ncbi:uncharacterized protein HD556DRAFT_1307913 [Suillus plorans]|uniref:Uncharacterized protein n=1 Tax=Suillus plorans TaxID=116603 RepID=A0A9P7AR72_9AGAM|nr:uncharacterized protein HD556DRAFT_1307913 [Suillus plorans]KAG1794531.1 hypothetical protein HD556DRAFT_1307913 [Suillus plorans]
MAPRSKYSPEQIAFMQTYHEKFLQCKANKNYEPFWSPFFEEWSKDIPLDEALSEEQLVAVAESWTLRQQMLGHIMKKGSAEKNYRVLKPWEMYSKIHYHDKVKDAVIAKQGSSSKPTKESAIHVITQQTKKAFEEESEEVREKVFAAVEAMKEKKRAEIQEAREQNKSDVNKEAYISKIASILTQFFEELHEMTDWVFTVLMGGPDPAMGGALDISSFHVGATKNNNRFSQTYPDFTQKVMVPYTQFVECVFPEAATLTRAKCSLPSGTSALPAHVSSCQNDDALGGIATDISPVFSGPALPAHALNTFTFNNQNDYHSAAASQIHDHSDVNFFSDFPQKPVDTAKDMELTQPLVLLPAPPRSPNTAYPSPSLIQLLLADSTLQPLIEQDPPLNYGLSSPPRIRHQFHNLGGLETTTDREYVFDHIDGPPASVSVPEQTASLPPLPPVPSASASFLTQSTLLPAPPPVTSSPKQDPPVPSASASFSTQSTLLPAPPPVMSPPEQEGGPSKRRKTIHPAAKGDARPPVDNSPVVEEGRGKRQRFQSKRAAAANDFGQIRASRKGKSARQ